VSIIGIDSEMKKIIRSFSGILKKKSVLGNSAILHTGQQWPREVQGTSPVRF